MTSINTNLGAYSAQQNLKTANALTLASISRLSSGNRIDKASTDVAGLSVGTILATNVSTLRKGLENAGQASSLLQVADGGLKNITNILQRQKALSVAATAGTLSAAERGYLNQEFQNLTQEIDRLVENTKFNSVKLLDGSLSKAAEQDVGARLSTANQAAVVSGTIITLAANPADNTAMSINGVRVTFTTQSFGTDAAAGKVKVGTNVTETMENVARWLNSNADGRLSGLVFRNVAGALVAENGAGLTSGARDVVGANINVAGASITVPATPATIATSTDFFGRSRVKAIGDMSNSSVLANGDGTTAKFGQGIILSESTVAASGTAPTGAGALGLDRTDAWLGKVGQGSIGKIKVIHTGAQDTIRLEMKVGDITYTSDVAAGEDITNATQTDIELYGRDPNNANNTLGGSFRLTFQGGLTAGTVDNQDEADQLADQINDSLGQLTFVQNRDVRSFSEGEVGRTASGVEVIQLDEARAKFQSDNFDQVKIGGFKIKAPGVGEADALITVNINGEEYRSFAGIGTTVKTSNQIVLQNISNPLRSLTIHLGSATIQGVATLAADFSTQEKADAAAAALDRAFGVEAGTSSLNFQIGAVSTDAIGVTIDDAGSADLFNNKTLTLETVEEANIASTTLDAAIARVTALRANIGALQSRFDYASANLETSIQNVDAARGSFLDANISEEATAFAQAQVKLQASISVLAQANQLPQNLLKLIG